MNAEAVKAVVGVIQALSSHYSTKDIITACFMWIRYGMTTFENTNDSDLEKIYAEIDKKNTIFDKELSYKVDKILNNKEVQ